MAGNSAGYKAGAKHFGLNENLVKQWARREKQAALKAERMRGKGRAQRNAPGPARAQPNKSALPADPPKKRGTVDADGIAPEVRQQLRRSAWGLAAYMAGVADVQEARKAAEVERATLRASGVTGKELDARCPMPSIDMRQVESAARALKTTLEIAPGLTAFEADTSEKTPESADGAAEMERLKAVFGEPTAPTLAVLAGGKVAP